MSTKTTALRDRIAAAATRGPLIAPGAFDGLSARLVELARFEAVYMTGFGAAASLLGGPDVGLLTATEMAGQAERLATATRLPLIADADTGYGNALNVSRTVAGYERAGVAAIQLEDQVSPKRCGHMSGKAVVSVAEMVAKLRAAADTRDDLLIIARTDAAAVEGIPAAIDRARRYRDAGADVLFVEAPETERDVEMIAAALATECPLLFNWVEGGRSPQLPMSRIAEFGFAVVLYPIGALLAATAGIRTFLAELSCAGTPPLSALPAFDEFTTLVGLPEVRDREACYAC
ncbi:isocitrate lyase/PEP mutase family protein [Mycolicibacterium wolinskyi]|uniref:Carboxyvinyl-carboxyphosphonate phosphorylmutase n=1 Tax=Mycolicibacterium wolinskyi TaxID=59750 RepID=A0A1X2F280_9MYCO|nr:MULTISPECIES: isocitrate lyase/PEP mutase family protein [Mycolicibacterium]MCV7287743.1 isocitrate lyase/PEP mutase family protein [Mycolicibacterium wolinskyi]MCV7294641.1 isocitrate lyase/PEP mutase family protein [Mycolicibacterium goodii]ORX12486.1 carboxyvinyl-carboxyphosphonate phosphorylmutase [Mycolicibacterium wolinskyi]